MNRALVIKELREIGWIAAIGVALCLLYVSALMGLELLWMIGSSFSGGMPFVKDGFYGTFVFIGLGVALGLGFEQSMGDGLRRTWVYLLHRPAWRASIFRTKISTGAVALVVTSAIPVAVYSMWAATPGTHASPFFWSMTADSWWAVACFPLAYLGAFLSGLRPARWFGTRLLPLVASLVLYSLISLLVPLLLGYVLSFALLCVGAALFVLAIQHAARLRDFG